MPRRTDRPASLPGAGLPDREAVLAFLRVSGSEVGKRDIARAFSLDAQAKIALKALLKEMAAEGLIEQDSHRAFRPAGSLAKLTTLRVVAINEHGEALGEPEEWAGTAKPPRIPILERKQQMGRGKPLGLGDRVLVRIEEKRSGRFRAHILKQLERAIEQILGVLRADGNQLILEAVNKKLRLDFQVATDASAGATPGELVLAEAVGRQNRFGPQQVKVIERLGSPFAPRSLSLIAIHQHGLPTRFSNEAIADAKHAAEQALGAREDLRNISLLTIDPIDARDHDDAIWAAADDDIKNPGGWQLIVAIADVSFFVTPGSALDTEARSRGNSAYFPDRVVPMLPEILSADVCSLLPDVDRACLACHMRIDAQGALIDFRFTRAVMRSHANLAYEVADARKSDPLLAPLWGAWQALEAARSKRDPLNIDIPERRVELDEAGQIRRIAPRIRLEAHKVVEEFMILANVAAARQLEKLAHPVVYRLHEAPSTEKVRALKVFLRTLEHDFSHGQTLRPTQFNRVIAAVRGSDAEQLVQEMVLRTQTQAYYGLDRLGHFGLALPTYAHFTSPIRRYADLLVHRALVSGLDLGKGGLDAPAAQALERTCEHISAAERRAMIAERDTIDRYVAAYLADKTGTIFSGRINGVSRFGLFVTLNDIGGDGLIPIRSLGQDYYDYDEQAMTLVGRTHGEKFNLGQQLMVRLIEAKPITGGLVFERVEGEETPHPVPAGKVLPKRRAKRPIRRSRAARARG